MDTKDLLKILRFSEEQLKQCLNQCKNGSSELVIFASKMSPLLADFSAIEAELLSSADSSEHAAYLSSEDTPPGTNITAETLCTFTIKSHFQNTVYDRYDRN